MADTEAKIARLLHLWGTRTEAWNPYCFSVVSHCDVGLDVVIRKNIALMEAMFSALCSFSRAAVACVREGACVCEGVCMCACALLETLLRSVRCVLFRRL